MVKRYTAMLLVTLLSLSLTPVTGKTAAPAVRIKDIAKIQGVRDNQLVGYGLVVGLAGTGDSSRTAATAQSIANMLKTYGITVTSGQITAKNVAAVMVTAKLPPFVKPGDNIDITVSSIGDAKSLQGGTLLLTPLKAPNGQVYAVGQGTLSVGGFATGSGGSTVQRNLTTVGRIANGAIVEREVPVELVANGEISLALNDPDFTTASRIAQAVNSQYGDIAVARDPGTVSITLPQAYRGDVVAFVATIEDLLVTPDSVAKVVINERTGTVVMGSEVSISEVAVSHGNLTVKITKRQEVSQPPPLSGGSTVVTPQTEVVVQEQTASLMVLPASAKVGDVVNGLNAVGATPRDVIAVLQAMKAAGALHATLEII